MIPVWVKYFLIKVRSKKAQRRSYQRPSPSQSQPTKTQSIYGKTYGYEYVSSKNEHEQDNSLNYTSNDVQQKPKRIQQYYFYDHFDGGYSTCSGAEMTCETENCGTNDGCDTGDSYGSGGDGGGDGGGCGGGDDGGGCGGCGGD
ncbi:hypothetical protein I4U23_020236 [Adineta vaga]|nr:hypothetical protein I4U23_020236 [Adineta vaga]